MKIIFAGTPDFAVPILQALLDSDNEVCAVYTQPDRPKGRGRKLAPSPVKALALAHQLPIHQVTSFKDEADIETLKHYQADLMVVVAYGLILPMPILETPRLGCINIHASLLPRYRGASPIQASLLAGDTITGVTIMQMDKGMDTGDILDKATCPIREVDTSESLHATLATLGAECLKQFLPKLAAGKNERRVQDHSLATYTKKITKEDGFIDWHQDAQQIERQIRAYNPWPVAFTVLNEERVRIWQARVVNQPFDAAPGTIIDVTKEGIVVACAENSALSLQLIQLPGGRKITVQQLLAAKPTLFSIGSQLGHA